MMDEQRYFECVGTKKDHEDPVYVTPTEIIDSKHASIRSHAEKIAGDSAGPVEKAIRLYLSVRDGIRYDPYTPFSQPEHYRASNILKAGRGFCIPKASLLCALGRACGIPSRLGFATVRNHLATKQLIDFLGSELFVYHAFVELHLEGKWVKATPAFNRELCERHKVGPLEFNGREDSLFQPYDGENRKFMEYVEYHGTYTDVPVSTIMTEWNKAYGNERVRNWIKMFEQGERPHRRFEKEDVFNA